MLAKIARLAGLSAFGGCGGLLALYAGLVFLTLPKATDGIDITNSVVTWISMGGVFAALIVVHIVIAKQLLRLGRGADKKHPL
jgi:hypothetical protein